MFLDLLQLLFLLELNRCRLRVLHLINNQENLFFCHRILIFIFFLQRQIPPFFPDNLCQFCAFCNARIPQLLSPEAHIENETRHLLWLIWINFLLLLCLFCLCCNKFFYIFLFLRHFLGNFVLFQFLFINFNFFLPAILSLFTLLLS